MTQANVLRLSPEQVRWFRLRRSGLVDPFESATSAASALVGIQAQILPAAAVSLWNRTQNFSYAQFEKLLYEKRELVKIWGQRGTLHLYPSREWPLIHGARAYQKTWWQRKSSSAGISPTQYQTIVQQVSEFLQTQQTATRSDLRASHLHIPDYFYDSWGGIFYELVHHGYACHAQAQGGEGVFAARQYWLPDLNWTPPASDTANVELMWRFFHAYGPATLHDFAFWRGVKLSDARRWLDALRAGLIEIEVAGETLLALMTDFDALVTPAPPRARWPVKMLYRFDPYLLAHKDKSWQIDTTYYKQVWRPAGHIEGVILDKGQIVATWRYQRSSTALKITVFPFKKLSKRLQTAVSRQARALADFFDLPLADLTFAAAVTG